MSVFVLLVFVFGKAGSRKEKAERERRKKRGKENEELGNKGEEKKCNNNKRTTK